MKTLTTLWMTMVLATAASAETAADLDAKQAALTQRLNHAQQIGDAHGRYVLVREAYFQGPDGTTTRADAWLQRTAKWTADWSALLDLVESAPSLTDESVQQKIRTTLASQLSTWETLRRDAALVTERAADGRARLAALPEFPRSHVPGYETQLEAFASRRVSLDDALRAASNGFEADAHATWQALVEETEAAVIRRLRKALLDYPALRDAVARVEETFRAEREAEPHVRTVQVAFNDLRDHTLRKRYFHAVDALEGLRKAAADADRALAALTLGDDLVRPARDAVARTLAAGEKLFTDSTRSFTPGMLVASFATTEARALATDCRDETLRLQRRCELLRQLASLPPTAIVGMNPTELREVEFGFARVRR